MDLLFDIPLAIVPRPCATFAIGVFVSVLVWAGVVDARHRIVPGGAIAVSVAAWASALGAALLSHQNAFMWRSGVLAGIVGAAVSSGFAFLCGCALSRVRKRTALGLGDVELLFVFGLYCGASGALACLFAACVLAVFYSCVRFAIDACVRFASAHWPSLPLRRTRPFDGTFPFVPFLAASFVLFVFFRLLL